MAWARTNWKGFCENRAQQVEDLEGCSEIGRIVETGELKRAVEEEP